MPPIHLFEFIDLPGYPETFQFTYPLGCLT
jgi:hypothetical protein